MAQLPEIKLTCKEGHSFATRARGGSSISCPACRPARVSVWVPKDRPRTAERTRARGGQGADVTEPDTELVSRWQQEPPWNGKLVILAARPGDDCPECGQPLHWEPGRTLTYCGTCKQLALPAAVAAHYRQRDQRHSEVATRSAPDATADRTERVRLRALAQRMTDQVHEWVDAFDPDGLSGGAERLALDYQAELSAYLPEIRNAGSQGELAAIMADIKALTDQASISGGPLDVIRGQRAAIERQQEAAERQAEWDEQAEQEAREAERQAEIEAQAERKAIESRATSKPVPKVIDTMGYNGGNGYVSAGVAAISMAQKYQAEKKRLLAERGSCGYEHKWGTAVAQRRYWITTLDWQGNLSGYELPDSPSVVVCKKHFAEADQWIEEQATLIATQRRVRILAVHTELT